MAEYQNLKDSIASVIKENGKGEITGQLLQNALIAMINELGSGAVFKGVATPVTDPANTDAKEVYFATQAGEYVGFGVTTTQQYAFIVSDGGHWVAIELGTNLYGEEKNAVRQTNATASGQDSAGFNASRAVGTQAFASGRNALASGRASTAENIDTTASGQASHAEGTGTTASATSAHAEGKTTNATGVSAHSEGEETTAQGKGAHAEGNNTSAEGDYSHAEGEGSVASGIASHAEGQDTGAEGHYSHAEGKTSFARADYSHAEGMECHTWEVGAHAEGDSTMAYGRSSHTEGVGTIAYNEGEHAGGFWNVSNSNTIYSIGCGTEDNNRKNAFEVWENGKLFIIGVGGFDGTNAGESGVKSIQDLLNA